MKEFRKIQTIEVVKQVVKGEAIENQLPGQVAECDGYLVQNKGEDSDRWVVPTEVFESTYESVKSADYAILTPEQREDIRERLWNVMTSAFHAAKTPADAADIIVAVQRRVGENLKTFEEKNQYLKDVMHHINRFVKSKYESIVTPEGLLISRDKD